MEADNGLWEDLFRTNQQQTLAVESPHRVKLATTIRRGRATLYVWECTCGLSSPLFMSKGLANAAYAEHKNSP